MQAYPVSKAVNSVVNNYPDVVMPVKCTAQLYKKIFYTCMHGTTITN